MKKFLFLLLSIILFIFMFQPVQADTGPKPYLEIEINNLKKSNYYIGLITYDEYNGPHIGINSENINEYSHYDEKQIQNLKTLCNVITLEDGCYLFDRVWFFENITDTRIKVSYYPPDDFNLVIYDSISDKIVVSVQYGLYAFGSYYHVDFSNQLKDNFKLSKNYNYTKEIMLLLIRIIITLLIEVGLAILLKFDKKSIVIIIIVNIVTQLILNFGLNCMTYFQGKNILLIILSFPLLLLFEIAILIIEFILYKFLCNRKDKGKKGIILYTIIANLLSFGFSFILWLFL